MILQPQPRSGLNTLMNCCENTTGFYKRRRQGRLILVEDASQEVAQKRCIIKFKFVRQAAFQHFETVVAFVIEQYQHIVAWYFEQIQATPNEFFGFNSGVTATEFSNQTI